MIYKPFEKWGSVLINHLLLVIPVIPMSLYKFVSSFVTKTHTHKHTRRRTHTLAHTHTHTHTLAHAHRHTHTHAHSQAHTYTHTHTDTDRHTHTHTHTHTHRVTLESHADRRSWISRSQTLQSELSQRVKVNLYFKSAVYCLLRTKSVVSVTSVQLANSVTDRNQKVCDDVLLLHSSMSL